MHILGLSCSSNGALFSSIFKTVFIGNLTIFRWSIMSVESSTACKEDREDNSSTCINDRGTTLSQEQKDQLLQQVEQLRQYLDEKIIASNSSDVVEKSDHEKLGKYNQLCAHQNVF